jgi:hypothetical protein
MHAPESVCVCVCCRCEVMTVFQCLWGVAKVGGAPNEQLTTALVKATHAVVHEAEPKALSSITWALAQLKVGKLGCTQPAWLHTASRAAYSTQLAEQAR